MGGFLASLGPFGWLVIAVAALALVQLPRALREACVRPWKARR